MSALKFLKLFREDKIMSRYYKKMLNLLIPLSVLFCLALALGSSEKPSELTQEEQNKVLVRQAILSFDEDPNDHTLPEFYDPNYLQYGPTTGGREKPMPHYSRGHELEGRVIRYTPVTFEDIIAEDDMVAVRLEWDFWDIDNLIIEYYTEIAIYRISGGKIVEGQLAGRVEQIDVYDLW